MIDRPDADPALLRGELRNLRVFNARVGSLESVRTAVLGLVHAIDPEHTIEILDLATGSADLPVDLADALRRAGRRVSITAVDKHETVLAVAREWAGTVPEIRCEQADIRELTYPDGSFDLAICSMALHHFSREDAVRILREMRRLSRVGFVVHDLSRRYRAAMGAWLYTRTTTTNIMTRRDALTSVMNAFTEAELREMCEEAGIGAVVVSRVPNFRLLAVHKAPDW